MLLTCKRGTFTGGQDPLPPPKKNHKAVIAFLSNTDPLPLKNHKATKTAFNVGPSIGPGTIAGGAKMIRLKSYLWYLNPVNRHQLKKQLKTLSELDPLLTIMSRFAHIRSHWDTSNKFTFILLAATFVVC